MDQANATRSPRTLAGLLTSIRSLGSLPNPQLMFERVASLCVRKLSEACVISLVEGDDPPVHIARGGTVADILGGQRLGRREVLAARHQVTGRDVVLPIVPPVIPDEPAYRGRLQLHWFSDYHPSTSDMALAQVVVDQAVTAIQTARMAAQLMLDRARAANLEIALESNRDIGMAMGIVMARHLVSAEEAFHLLRRVSQLEHRKLREVAAEVVLTGCLPGLGQLQAAARGPAHRTPKC